ncbi:MAG: hypothetical protein KDC26_03400 [Armatimonadetes bacterium]|nr:hypothetical protein [Armatimonadota bacterium]
MLWTQAAICFVVWIAFGIWVWRKFGRPGQLSGVGGKWKGILFLFGGAFFFFSGIFALASTGGIQNGQMTIPAWIACAFLGCVFVGMQTLGAAQILAALANETPARSQASQTKEGEQ